jgi:hypothetical protein
VLVVNGIPIADSITHAQREFLLNKLTEANTKINVLEKEPEGIFVEKAFAGIVLLTITDKKTSKKFRKLE